MVIAVVAPVAQDPPFGVADGWLVIFSRAARIWSF
jgi:hypothetical protein